MRGIPAAERINGSPVNSPASVASCGLRSSNSFENRVSKVGLPVFRPPAKGHFEMHVVCLRFTLLTLLLCGMTPGLVRLSAAEDPPIGKDEGLPRVSWTNARKAVGRVATVYGRIETIGHTLSLIHI